jgi:predicted dehydrogenase
MNRRTFITHMGLAGVAMAVAPVTGCGTAFAGKKIRIGIIGCGSVAGVYLPHLTRSPYAEVVSLCDIKFDRVQMRGKEFQVKNLYRNIDEMLNGAPFDLLVDLTDMQAHEDINRKAILAKKHVWSEKPIANTYEGGKRLLDLSVEVGVGFWGAPAVVNSPQFAFMSRQIQQRRLGRVAAAHAHYGHQGPGWSAFFYEEGGGSLPDLGVYNISTLTGLLGPVRSVVAMTTVVTPTRYVDDKGDIQVVAEDNAMLIMEHRDNVLSHVQCGFNYFDPYGHEGTGQDRPTISIVGSEGNMHMIGYDWAPSGVDMATVQNEKTIRVETDVKGYVWQEGASVICEYLATGKKPLITAEHALHVLEIMEAARLSQAEGKRIALQSSFKWPIVN